MNFRTFAATTALVAVVASSPGAALAWGAAGHRMIGTAGAQALPAEVPAFLRAPGVAAQIGELAREPDRSKGAGQPHDGMRDPAHFIDLDDDGRVLGGPSLDDLPNLFNDYDGALRAAGQDPVKAGWLSYAMVDGWQQLVRDFALWRAAAAGERFATDPARKAWLAADRARREQLIIRDLGTWAHYVGDASQPHHTSVHFNGWGDFPNPEGFTNARVHGPFEGKFVFDNAALAQVRGGMAEPKACVGPFKACVATLLKATNATVVPFYALEKAGGFQPGDARGKAFATERLAAGASALRDFTVDAWRASAEAKVGWPEVSVKAIEAGQIDPYDFLYGTD
ncbi:S1/P1 Nuclease [Caulobacter sp. 17J80-11]|uniref:S1/P1 Nuclease n=1 Tax=Caulobacter sp. 17J80-11 TaxID=2763502 RepID=UPI001653EC43|nr:S1/P1 Nuclease [Caulobacter sp. 17J80-11]MBC6983269.1 S1/P1 Nuclease [Caulobacter sp. 17J80-11]